jgi:hypothetical protein
MKIIEFKENKQEKKLVTDEGIFIVDENTISNLHMGWLVHPSAIRKDTETHTVFSFKEPVDYDDLFYEGKKSWDEFNQTINR